MIASSSAIAYIPTCQPFPPHRKQLRHTAVAAAVPAMISHDIRRSKHLRHTEVAAAAWAMISRVILRSKHRRHTAVAAAAPAMISGVIRRSKHLLHTAVAAAAPAMISRVIRRSSQPHAPSLALSRARGTKAATVQRRRNISTAVETTATVPTRIHSSSTDAAPMVARGTVRHFRSSSQAPAPSLASTGSRGTLAAMGRRSRRRRQ